MGDVGHSDKESVLWSSQFCPSDVTMGKPLTRLGAPACRGDCHYVTMQAGGISSKGIWFHLRRMPQAVFTLC